MNLRGYEDLYDRGLLGNTYLYNTFVFDTMAFYLSRIFLSYPRVELCIFLNFHPRRCLF